jgi:hypothetical protein
MQTSVEMQSTLPIASVAPTPDSWPQVSFDIHLGERTSNLEFDTQAYADYLRERGLNDQEVADTRLHFAKASNPFKGGGYDEKTKILTVNMRPFPLGSIPAANELIYHETEHHIDDLHGALKEESWALAKVGAALGVGAISLAAVGIAARNNEVLYAALALDGAAGASIVGKLAAYRLSRQERVARSVAKANQERRLTSWEPKK